VNWKPTKAVVDKINKLFHTFRFTTTGRMYAQRGREFARDAEVLTKMLKKYEINGAYNLEGRGPVFGRRRAADEPEDERAVLERRVDTAIANGQLPNVLAWFHGLNLDFCDLLDTLGDPLVDGSEYFFLFARDNNIYFIPSNLDNDTLEEEIQQTFQDHDIYLIIRYDVDFSYNGWVEDLPEVRFSQMGIDIPEGTEDIIDTEPLDLGEEVVYARNGVLNPIRTSNARNYKCPDEYTTAARIPDLEGVVRGAVGSGRRR
jgi:hypothetical protein